MEFNLAAILSGIVISVANTVAGVIEALTPFGIGFCLALILIGIAFMGIAYMAGATAAFVPAAANLIAVSLGTLWVISVWAYIVGLSNATAGYALRTVGVDGIPAMFELAQVSSDRIIAETVGLSLAPDLGVSESIYGAICAIIVLIGMSVPGIIAMLAEVELLLAAAVAPMLLPMLASPAFRGIGFSAIRFQIAAVILIVVQGLITRVLSDAVLAALLSVVVAPDAELTNPQIQTLVVVAILAFIMALGGVWIAMSITSSSPGALGAAVVARLTATAAGATRGAASAIGSAVGDRKGGGKGASAGGGHAGTVQPKSRGSAFA